MQDFKKYANSFQAKSRLGLETTYALCKKCGSVQKKLRFVHVAGTNGKGSVCAFLQCILTDSGLRTGKFISPNMIDVCERISVDGENISGAELDTILETVEKAAKEVEKELGVMPTQFEIWTAAAFIYFEKRKCDIVVLETGLGGRLDATNIIDSPLCSVITKIDIDHIDYLGDTIEKIALEKAGIIKESSAVIALAQKKSVTDVLKKTAREKNSLFIEADKCRKHRREGMSEIFDLKDLKNLKINLPGLHQTENAALAVKTAQFLNVEEKYIRSGLLRAVNIGRFEKLSDNPAVIFDGAHNANGTAALIKSLKRYFPKERLSFIYASMGDKDISASLRLFRKHGFCRRAQFFAVKVKDNPRAKDAKKLAEELCEKGFCAQSCESISEAYEKATALGNTTVICGSLYLYKDFKEM